MEWNTAFFKGRSSKIPVRKKLSEVLNKENVKVEEDWLQGLEEEYVFVDRSSSGTPVEANGDETESYYKELEEEWREIEEKYLDCETWDEEVPRGRCEEKEEGCIETREEERGEMCNEEDWRDKKKEEDCHEKQEENWDEKEDEDWPQTQEENWSGEEQEDWHKNEEEDWHKNEEKDCPNSNTIGPIKYLENWFAKITISGTEDRREETQCITKEDAMKEGYSRSNEEKILQSPDSYESDVLPRNDTDQDATVNARNTTIKHKSVLEYIEGNLREKCAQLKEALQRSTMLYEHNAKYYDADEDLRSKVFDLRVSLRDVQRTKSDVLHHHSNLEGLNKTMSLESVALLDLATEVEEEAQRSIAIMEPRLYRMQKNILREMFCEIEE